MTDGGGGAGYPVDVDSSGAGIGNTDGGSLGKLERKKCEVYTHTRKKGCDVK